MPIQKPEIYCGVPHAGTGALDVHAGALQLGLHPMRIEPGPYPTFDEATPGGAHGYDHADLLTTARDGLLYALALVDRDAVLNEIRHGKRPQAARVRRTGYVPPRHR